MPRVKKRRKSASQRKASLIFTESPVNLTPTHTSPVRCANHPTTAQVVPVEELADLTWVSPQFRGPVSGRRRRGRHRAELSRNSINTRSRRSNSKENLQCSLRGRKNLPKGFVPLRLQWDKSEADIQDISEAESTDVEFNCSRNINLQTSTIITPTSIIRKNNEQHSNDPSETISTANRLSVDKRTVRINPESNGSLLDLSTLTRLARNSERINPRVLFTSDSDSDSMIRPHRIVPRRSVRLRDKYAEAVALLRSPVIVDKVLTYHVLAPDTPESEYGIPRKFLTHKLLKQNVLPT